MCDIFAENILSPTSAFFQPKFEQKIVFTESSVEWCVINYPGATDVHYYSRPVNNVHFKVYKYEKQVDLMKKKL